MPTFQELAKTYAKELRQAIRTDGFVRGKYLTESMVRASETTATLKWIDKDLDRYQISGRPLTDTERGEILEIAAEELGSSVTESVKRATKAASNDSFTDLVDKIDDLLR